MRPLQLTIQAFGPYAACEVIDFEEALKSGLFGIYGPTGSGKSSIFSALCFVLFGESARGDKDTMALRSDHAKPNCLTEVELIFDIGAQRYLIRRRPKQERESQRGGGTTMEAHAAWLFDVTGIPVGEISEENTGKVLAEKKTSFVAEELESILGYGAKQFRQIVLLPQGQFETFLTAKTDDRLSILRDLFDVSLYKRLSHKMKDEAKSLQNQINLDRDLFQALLDQDEFASLDDLKTGLKAVKGKMKPAGEAAQATRKKIADCEKASEAARHDEVKFIEAVNADTALKELLDRSTEMDQAKITLAGAAIAQSLADLDGVVVKAVADAAGTKKQEKAALVARDSAQEADELAADGLKKELARGQELEGARKNLSNLRRFEKTLGSARGLGGAVDEAAKQEGGAAKSLRQSSGNLDKLAEGKVQKTQELVEAHRKAKERSELSSKLDDVKRSVEARQAYDAAFGAIGQAEGKIKKANSLNKTAVLSHTEAKTVFEEAEVALAGAQAIHLAEKLVVGEACAVCGSTEHPAPAMGDAESAGLDQAFREAREAKESAQQKESAAAGELKVATGILVEREAALAGLAKPDRDIAELMDEETSLKEKLDEIGEVATAAELQASIEQIDTAIGIAKKELELFRGEDTQAKEQLAAAKGAHETALSEVPEDLRNEAALKSETLKIEEAVLGLERSLELAQKTERETKEVLISLDAALKGAVSNVKKSQEAVANAKTRFEGRLSEKAMDLDEYAQHKTNIDQIEELKSAIESHGKELATTTERLRLAKLSIKELVRPDMKALEAALVEAAEKSKLASDAEAKLKAQVERLVEQKKKLAGMLAKIENAEIAYAPLGAIAAAFNGDNKAKMQLETFAIAAMFDRVLDAANLRLQPMTGGQYSLERDYGGGKGSGKRGLGIVVHDTHTGKPRPTSSLSGGETFMAALALALGLSDVVESESGGIRLDTIFIDEGFGSLDMETLDQTLQTLQDLVGQNRAVGLISHVELVQQAIPHGFRITKSVAGSHVEVGQPS